MKQNIALIGLPYSGKSFLSKFLSLKKLMYLVETDKQIENKYNLKLQNIIDNYGELEFINIENEVIRELIVKIQLFQQEVVLYIIQIIYII